MIVIADGGKRVATLGRFPLPIEVVAFGFGATLKKIEAAVRAAGASGELTLRRTGDGAAFRPTVATASSMRIFCASSGPRPSTRRSTPSRGSSSTDCSSGSRPARSLRPKRALWNSAGLTISAASHGATPMHRLFVRHGLWALALLFAGPALAQQQPAATPPAQVQPAQPEPPAATSRPAASLRSRPASCARSTRSSSRRSRSLSR